MSLKPLLIEMKVSRGDHARVYNFLPHYTTAHFIGHNHNLSMISKIHY